MGWRDKINQGVEQSKSLQLEFNGSFDPKTQFAVPGNVISGDVVIRNPQPLSISELRITIYGITEATVLRKISTIKNYFFGRGFLFQEITVLVKGPVTLQPNQDGYRYPFSFTMPEMAMFMPENEANFINKFKSRPPFLGAQEMHPLPPSFGCKKTVLLGFHESSVVYHLDVTCTKGPGGGSFWLPQTGSTFKFSPSRKEQNPDPAWQSIASSHQLKSGGALQVCFQVPSVACAGSPFPLRVNVETLNIPNAAIVLTDLEVVFVGTSVTRARSFLLGEKTAEDQVGESHCKTAECECGFGSRRSLVAGRWIAACYPWAYNALLLLFQYMPDTLLSQHPLWFIGWKRARQGYFACSSIATSPLGIPVANLKVSWILKIQRFKWKRSSQKILKSNFANSLSWVFVIALLSFKRNKSSKSNPYVIIRCYSISLVS